MLLYKLVKHIALGNVFVEKYKPKFPHYIYNTKKHYLKQNNIFKFAITNSAWMHCFNLTIVLCIDYYCIKYTSEEVDFYTIGLQWIFGILLRFVSLCNFLCWWNWSIWIVLRAQVVFAPIFNIVFCVKLFSLASRFDKFIIQFILFCSLHFFVQSVCHGLSLALYPDSSLTGQSFRSLSNVLRNNSISGGSVSWCRADLR